MTRARRIAIIGAGPTGIAAAKYLVAEDCFDAIDIYEQRGNVGGLWQATPNLKSEASTTMPSVKPSEDVEEPFWREYGAADSNGSLSPDPSNQGSGSSSPGVRGHTPTGAPVFLSPIYDDLETNIPAELMKFSDHAFPEGVSLFPKHQIVQSYLEQYAEDVRHLVRFEMQVLDVRLHHKRQHESEDYQDVWEIVFFHLPTRRHGIETYDAIVCANGHFATPYIPDIAGIKEWQSAHPESMIHAKYYRKPEPYAGKKMLLVGHLASGFDIGAQIAPYAQKPLLVSVRSKSEFSSAGSPYERVELPTITSLDATDRSVYFSDGHVERNVDGIVFCTGYLYSYPSLLSLDPPVVTDGTGVRNTFLHLFYAPHPTLTFPGLPKMTVPFPTGEAQASVIARYYAGRLDLPSYEEMAAWERRRWEEVAEKGLKQRAAFHLFQFPQDVAYINALRDWADSARGEGEGKGKRMPGWSDWHYWCRGRFAAVKMAFAQRGEKRHEITDLKQLGFDFDAWLKEKPDTEGVATLQTSIP